MKNVPARAVGPRPGFTLLEVLLAIMIGGLLVASVMSSTRAITRARTGVDERMTRVAEARRAMELIVGALRDVRRDPVDQTQPLIIGRQGGVGGSDRIDMQVISSGTVRANSAESDQQEVGFYLQTIGQSKLSSLMCRRDHGLDEHPDEGGVATVVAQGIVGLSFEYYAAGEWYRDWSSTQPQPPEAVRVTLTAATEPSRSTQSLAGRREAPDVVVLTSAVTLHASRPNAQSGQNDQKGKQDQPSGGEAR